MRNGEETSAARPLESRDQETKRLIEACRELPPMAIAELGTRAALMREVRPLRDEPLGPGVDKAERYAQAMTRTGLTLDNVDQAFQYQPWDREQAAAGAIVVEALVAAAKAILRQVPEGPDRSVALRKLREVRMDCNSAITFRGRF